MLKWLIDRRLDAFARSYEYDVSYLRALLEIDLRAFLAFARLSGVSTYCKGAPVDAWYAAKICGAMAEDCGPCTQLVVNMAERAGVTPAVLQAIVGGRQSELPESPQLAWRFARATLAHDAAAATLREQVVARWGQRGLVSLAFALVSSRLYPTLKYALGFGHACTRVVVSGQPVAVAARS
jgi:hypothetical protein